MTSQFDFVDRKILDELQLNGRLSMVELATRVNLTKTPCSQRVRRLEKHGVIRGYSAEIDPAKVNLNCVTIVYVNMMRTFSVMETVTDSNVSEMQGRVGKRIADGPTYAGVTAAERAKAQCETADRTGGGWWAYEFVRPGSETPTRKVSYMTMVKGRPWLVGAGVYDQTTPIEEFEAASRSAP